MGPCEQLVEPACVSPRVFVADGVEEIVANAAAEGFLERAVEPVLSLPSVERGGGDSVIESVAQKRCLLDSGGALGELGMEDRSESIIMYDCLKPSFKTSEGFVGRIELECADGREESVCDALGKRLDELVLMPISEELCKLDQSSGTIENSYENARDIGPGTACIDADVEPVIERHDVKCEHADNKSESGNASSIKSCLNKIYLEGGQCECEMNSCPLNLTKDGLLPLGKPQVAGALSGSAALCMSDFKADSDIAGSPVETVGAGTMDNGAFKSSVIPDTFGLDSCVATPNHIGDTEKDNAWTDGGTCDQKFTEASFLPLRRSSRSKKSVQQLHKGKNATKGTKKAPKVSLSRTIDLLSEATRKKRSSLSRSICPSSWGRSENLSKYFQQNNEISKNQTIGHRPGKKKAGQRSRKKNMLKVVASSQSSERQQEVPCRRIRLKVTFGGKEELTRVDGMPSAVVDALPGNEGKGLNLFTYIDSSEGNVMDSSVSVEIPRLMQCNNSTSNVQLVGSNLEICPESGKCSHEGSSQFDRGDRSCMDKLSDPGTSPDSEVIDQVHDSIIGPRESCGNVFPGSNSFPATLKKSKNRRYKKDKLCQAGNPVLEYQHSADRAKVSKRGTQPQKVVDGLCGTDNVDMDCENLPSNTSGSELVFTELLPVVDEVSPSAPSLGSGADNTTYSRMNIVIESANSGNSCQLSPPKEIQGKRKSKGSRAKGKPRNKSELMDAVRHEKEHSKQQKGKNKLSSKNKVTETGILSEAYKIRAQPGTGNHDVADVEKADSSNEVPLKNAFCLGLVPTGAGEQTLASRVAWVCCDDCLKWRCIPAELADAIEETNCRWTCKDNQDQAFADCSIPQKKSNAEINAELQISDEDDARDGHLGSMDSGLGQSVASQPSTWMLVKSNLFLHRSRKALTMDEIMVCHCKPPVDGRLGCGSQCLNRMLNIECIQGTCPCGDRCSNQLFQKQQYVKLSWFRCGKKGYGLQVLEHVSEGQFLIEYVGEVLDLQSYEARQKDYAAKGHKHFYFMTLNGNEVIDASAKGNLGRFVNHSCDPNCRTEKWVVNGEICVGLFAMRNIKKGEELTFDYNYVRVFGAAAKKCHCGSRKCRGYIGGDPLNAQVIVQGDSDEEFPEPVVVDENGKIDHSLEDMMAKSSSQDVDKALHRDSVIEEKPKVIVDTGDMLNKIKSSIDDIELSQTMPLTDTVHESTNSSFGLRSKNLRTEPVSDVQSHISRTERTTSMPTSSPESKLQRVEMAIQKSFSGSIDSFGRVSEADIECEPPQEKPRSRMKISRPSKSVKNRKLSNNSVSAGKTLLTAPRSKILSYKPKKLLEGSVNGFEAVEEKLNELLDAHGGICKKKDASKGYLKLLLLTAASGDSGNGGAIQSNRDLSMILDAMLKTKSHGVLLDIINKNGLQMLHNMMKLYRRDFKKIPILRKLLKVFEFLAEKEILTLERINGDSLHPGVESLRESILVFTEHDDYQVHQIARSFRDRWIPRKFGRMENFNRRREFRKGSDSNRCLGTRHHWQEQGAVQTERITCSDQSGTMKNPADARMHEASCSQLTDSQTSVSRPRKRKSRWDQPAYPSSPKNFRISPKFEISEGGQTLGYGVREERDCSGAQSSSKLRDKGTDDVMQNSDDDAPPGFSCLRGPVDDSPPGFSSFPHCPPLTLGLLQERFNPGLPVAYGIPLSIVQQFGSLQCGTVDSWAIAPVIPFQPYPPLPPYPRERRQMRDQTEAREGHHSHAGNERDQGVPSTSDASLSHAQNTVATNQNMLHNDRDLQDFPGRRYNRQNKCNNQKPRLPCLRNLDGWGFKGNHPSHPRNGSCDSSMETVANELKDQHLADANHSIEYAGNSC